MKKFGFSSLPTGKIVGKATLKEVKHYNNTKEFKADQNLHLASEEWGNYGFVIENAQRVKEIECKGNLNFWNFEEKTSQFSSQKH